MKSIFTLKKDYPDVVLNLMFNTITKDIIEKCLYKMLYSFEYNDFFQLNDKYNIVVDILELEPTIFIIRISTDEDYVALTLKPLEVINVP